MLAHDLVNYQLLPHCRLGSIETSHKPSLAIPRTLVEAMICSHGDTINLETLQFHLSSFYSRQTGCQNQVLQFLGPWSKELSTPTEIDSILTPFNLCYLYSALLGTFKT